MQQLALVVDDSRVARMTLKKLLLAHDLNVVEQGSGEDALAYLQGDNVKPDIIFMDVMMGGMDGLTATQHIKADDKLKHIPVVVCTGHDTDADRDKSVAVGAVATLTKPPQAESLDAIITELAQHMAPQKEVAAEPAVDAAALLAELRAVVRHDLLPPMQQELRDLAETVSRQVATDTAEQQVTLLANNAPETTAAVDPAAVMNIVENDLLPKIHRDIREMTEDISRQIAADTAEQMVAEQVKIVLDGQLPALTEQILEQTKQLSEELTTSIAKKVAHNAVAKSAENAVQNAMSEFKLHEKIAAMLNAEGKVWLQRQERQVFDKLMQQVEVKFAPMAEKHLSENLTHMVGPIVHTVVDEALAKNQTVSQEDEDDEVLDKLKKQISMLKMGMFGLAGTVLLLAVNMFI